MLDIWDFASRGEIPTKTSPHTRGNGWAICLARHFAQLFPHVCGGLNKQFYFRFRTYSTFRSETWKGLYTCSIINNYRKFSWSLAHGTAKWWLSLSCDIPAKLINMLVSNNWWHYIINIGCVSLCTFNFRSSDNRKSREYSYFPANGEFQ